MREKLTFKELLTNPAGKGSAMLARRDEIIDNLKKRCLLAVAKNQPELAVFTENKGYVMLFSIPSEEYPLYFDVVLRFIPVEGEDNSRTLSGYQMEFFSNSPNFNFTYAYVLNRDGWLISELKNKISRQALTEPPDVRNPSGLFGFEKSIFFAALLIKEYNLSEKSNLTSHIDGKVNWKNIVKTTKSFEEKMTEYEKAKEKVSKEKKRIADQEKKKKLKTKGVREAQTKRHKSIISKKSK
jgi:hypothetical protein